MKVLKTSIDEIDEEIIFKAIKVLADGGVVLYPTDTVYGLGANIFDKKAVKRVFEIKRRSYLKPLSILVKDVETIDLVAKISMGQKNTIMEYLPGPYTFILDKRSIVPRIITSGTSYVGVRVPGNGLARRLAGIFPITTTSANISDDEVLTNPSDILNQLDCEVDLVIDVGDLGPAKSSTIVDLTSFKPKIIRK